MSDEGDKITAAEAKAERMQDPVQAQMIEDEIRRQYGNDVYVVRERFGTCMRCGKIEDLRYGACFDCAEHVMGRQVHQLWDKDDLTKMWFCDAIGNVVADLNSVPSKQDQS